MRTAVKALETAIAIEPHNVGLLKDAGTIFRQAGLLVKAEKAYQEALRWDPSAGEVRRALEEVRAQAGRQVLSMTLDRSVRADRRRPEAQAQRGRLRAGR